jgi:hypothetical protein
VKDAGAVGCVELVHAFKITESKPLSQA